MNKRNIITDVALWLSIVFVCALANWQISEVFRTREIMVNKNDARLQRLEDRVDMLDFAILSGEKP